MLRKSKFFLNGDAEHQNKLHLEDMNNKNIELYQPCKGSHWQMNEGCHVLGMLEEKAP